MQTTSALTDIEERIQGVYLSFRALLSSSALDDDNDRRQAVERGIAETISHRKGWSSGSETRFVYSNGMHLDIDSSSAQNTLALIQESAKKVLRIELEAIENGAAPHKPEQIQQAVSQLVSDNDWQIYFTRKRIDQTSSR